MPSHFGGYILSHSRRLVNDVIKQRGGFYNSSFYYTDTDSLYIHIKYWSWLVDNGFVGKTLGLFKKTIITQAHLIHGFWFQG